MMKVRRKVLVIDKSRKGLPPRQLLAKRPRIKAYDKHEIRSMVAKSSHWCLDKTLDAIIFTGTLALDIVGYLFVAICFLAPIVWIIMQIFAARELTQWFLGTGKYGKE